MGDDGQETNERITWKVEKKDKKKETKDVIKNVRRKKSENNFKKPWKVLKIHGMVVCLQ